MNKPESLDYFDPAFIMAMIMAVMSDVCFIFMIALLIPGIGLFVGAMITALHYVVGIIIGFIVVPRLHHFIPKLVVSGGIILPLPLLSFSIFLALPLQNKLIEQGALVVGSLLLGPEVGVIGKIAEVGTAGREVVGAGEAAAEAGELAGAMGEGATAAGEIGATANEGREFGGNIREGLGRLRDHADEQDEAEDAQRNSVSPEDLGEEPFFFDKLAQEDLDTPPAAPDKKENENVTIRKDGTIDLAA